MTIAGEGTTRRGFLALAGVAAGGVAVQGALPWGTPKAIDPAVPDVDGIRAAISRWYDETIEGLTRAWEPRFRYRQYRPDEPEGEEDYETREGPRDELSHVLATLPVLQDEASALLVLAASEQTYDDGASTTYRAAEVMSLDMLERAERLGYFARPCPEDLRFPDLPVPIRGFMEDDLPAAERDLESAEEIAHIRRDTRVFSDAKRAEGAAKLTAARDRLAAIRSGKIPALTKAEKIEGHAALRREIVFAYKARLEAAGHDAGWVEVPPCPYVVREAA